MRGIKSGYGNNTLPLWAVFNLYVIFIITSLLARHIADYGRPAEDLPGHKPARDTVSYARPQYRGYPLCVYRRLDRHEVQQHEAPQLVVSALWHRRCIVFVAPNMITLILLSFLIGITAGIVSPLSTAFIADLFGGSKRTEQYGYTSAVLNGV